MMRKLLLGINFILFPILEVLTQNYEPTNDEASQNFQYYPYNNMEDSFRQYPNPQYLYNKWNIPERINYEEYNDYTKGNTCNCENCEVLTTSCRNMCPNCGAIPSPYYYLQYPYPYAISTESPEPQEETETTRTTMSTITEPSTISTEPTSTISEASTKPVTKAQTDILFTKFLKDSNVPDVSKSFYGNDKAPYIMTSIRRTRPNWIPKYGVVPISNQFAEKLMLKLRSMKVLHPRKDNLRDVNELKQVD